MVSDASSSTSMGSKVFGSERKTKRSSAPDCAVAGRAAKRKLAASNASLWFLMAQSPPDVGQAENSSRRQEAKAAEPAARDWPGPRSNSPALEASRSEERRVGKSVEQEDRRSMTKARITK